MNGLRSDERFQDLEDAAKHLAISLAKGESNLTKLVKDDGQRTRDHVAEHAERQQRSHADEKFCNDVKTAMAFGLFGVFALLGLATNATAKFLKSRTLF